MRKLDIIVKTLEDKQAYDIKVIDLENKSSIADYFVLATGNSINQNKALIEYIEENLKKEGRIEGRFLDSAVWVVPRAARRDQCLRWLPYRTWAAR